MAKNKIRGFIGVKSNDGHDAPILYVAELMQKAGIEVIYGGYRLEVDQFVKATIDEGVHFTGISSYNGGHVGFFKAVQDGLKKRGHENIHIIGGGGATITPEDIAVLEAVDGIDKVFRSGAGNTITDFITQNYDYSLVPDNADELISNIDSDESAVPALISLVEEKARLDSVLDDFKSGMDLSALVAGKDIGAEVIDSEGKTVKEIIEQSAEYDTILKKLTAKPDIHTFGFTGRGGSGKSTLIDELAYKFSIDDRLQQRRLAVIAIDPSTNTSGGAVLADRMRYTYATKGDWVDQGRIYIRSLASRGSASGITKALPGVLTVLKAAGYDVFVETYGTGQADTSIAGLVDQPVFVTTPDFGDETQALKEDMLNVKDVMVALNKCDLDSGRAQGILERRVPKDALFATKASRHDDPSVSDLYRKLTERYG